MTQQWQFCGKLVNELNKIGLSSYAIDSFLIRTPSKFAGDAQDGLNIFWKMQIGTTVGAQVNCG
jgi:hypothetical protein